MNYRVIFYHKQATSARTRFIKFGDNSVLAPQTLPESAQLAKTDSNCLQHPASALAHMEQLFGFTEGMLKAEGEYLQLVEADGETIQIILANIDSMDPPFDLVEKNNAQFIDLTQARGLAQIELQLLRFAYDLIMGG